MPDLDAVVICSRSTQYTMIVPNALGLSFIEAFGKVFATRDPKTGESLPKAVDGYRKNPTGWHITISIADGDEEKLFEFIAQFSDENNLSPAQTMN